MKCKYVSQVISALSTEMIRTQNLGNVKPGNQRSDSDVDALSTSSSISFSLSFFMSNKMY